MKRPSSTKGRKRPKGPLPKIDQIPPIQPAFRGPAFPNTLTGLVKGNSKASGLLTDPTLPNPLARRRPSKKGGKT
jgi:hypothetical protein